MESFFSFLERRVDDCSSLLCVGLDPHLDDLAAPTAASALEFCLRLVKATSQYAAAFKPNAAFFEAHGAEGWTALKAVIDAIHAESLRLGSHIPVILDAKRGDIASSAAAYARSAFKLLGADAITLSPYLGRDSIEPFTRDREKGAFLLCKTSNPDAGEIQDLSIAGGGPAVPLHLRVAHLAARWNTQDNIGLVVGATYPETLSRVHAIAPRLWILVPGVGAQAGDLDAVLRAGLRPDGKGILINVSRGISRAADPRLAAGELRDAINAGRSTAAAPGRDPNDAALAELADGLLEAGCIKFGEFTLKSGMKSPIYIDLRQALLPPLLARIGGLHPRLENKFIGRCGACGHTVATPLLRRLPDDLAQRGQGSVPCRSSEYVAKKPAATTWPLASKLEPSKLRAAGLIVNDGCPDRSRIRRTAAPARQVAGCTVITIRAAA
jgi:uridine monophosphate synthetase